MQCVEFEDRLNRLLDHRLSPDDDESLADHGRECEECASLFQAQQRLFVGLHSDKVAAPASLAERVVSQRHWEVTRRQATWRNAGWAVLLASAASLGGLALMALKSPDNQPNVVKAPSPGAPVRPNKQGFGIAIAEVGPKTANDAKADERLEQYLVALENIASQISDPKEFDEMSESLEPSIKPIRSSFGLAIDALWRTFPRGKEARPTKPDAGASWLPEAPVIS